MGIFQKYIINPTKPKASPNPYAAASKHSSEERSARVRSRRGPPVADRRARARALQLMICIYLKKTYHLKN